MTDAIYGFFPGTRIPRKSPPQDQHDKRGVCKYCGEEDLIWEMHGDRWRLVDVGGRRHVCKSRVDD